MESISSAATTIGFISFSFQFVYHLHYTQSPSEAKEQINSSFRALIASIVALSNILHHLESQPRNPMVSLPAELGAAAEACASDLIRIEASLRLQQVKSESLVRSKMELVHADVDKMQGILQTNIDALCPYTLYLSPATNSKRPEEANQVGMSQQSNVDISTKTYRDNLGHTFHESIITTPGFQYQDYYSSENDENMQVLFENFELSSNMSGVIEQLFQGKVNYSRRQLYKLLNLLKELYDFGAIRDGNGWKQRKAMLESQWWPKILACLRRLSNLAGVLPTESPSVEAHEAIVALKLLAIGVRRSFDGESHAETGLQGQHNSHLGIMSENDEGRCLSVKFTFGHPIAGNSTGQSQKQVLSPRSMMVKKKTRPRTKQTISLADLKNPQFRRFLGLPEQVSKNPQP